jgi:hypothetical protein
MTSSARQTYPRYNALSRCRRQRHSGRSARPKCTRWPIPASSHRWSATLLLGAALLIGCSAERVDQDLSYAELPATVDHQSTSIDVARELKPVAVATSGALSSAWQDAFLIDANPTTVWSSKTFLNPAQEQWLSWYHEPARLTHIKLRPRYDARGVALGFPVVFHVSLYLQGQLQRHQTYTSYPRPHSGDDIIIPVQGVADNVLIVATTLGQDDYGNHVFQLAEVSSGFDPQFTHFVWQKNAFDSDPHMADQNQIQGVGADAFDPNKLSEWHYDVRNFIGEDGIFPPRPGTWRNIYAPQAVYLGEQTWYMYYGGWDGTDDPHDRISMVRTDDNFGSFWPRVSNIIQPNKDAGWDHTTNMTVQYVPGNIWYMAFTTQHRVDTDHPLCYPDFAAYGACCMPGLAYSTDGVSWSAGLFDESSVMPPVANYYADRDIWPDRDINAAQVIRYDEGQWHFYFMNNKDAYTTAYATGPTLSDLTYRSVMLGRPTGRAPEDQALSPQSVARFGRWYFSIYGMVGAGPKVWYTLSERPDYQGATASDLFSGGRADGRDRYISSAGLVQDGTRVHGVLYGAVKELSGPEWVKERIFGIWLQKRVKFVSTSGNVLWQQNRGFGSTTMRLTMLPGDLQTGRFYVYDTDSTPQAEGTLLYTSPLVTMRAGDVWQYVP